MMCVSVALGYGRESYVFVVLQILFLITLFFLLPHPHPFPPYSLLFFGSYILTCLAMCCITVHFAGNVIVAYIIEFSEDHVAR